ncbi:MAG: hypothetical protein ACRCUY_04000 [Thermoguttaceae bacterium]
MLKIGGAMRGKSVVCPQCRTRLDVPLQSDQTAESLFQIMKQKRNKSAHSFPDGIIGPKNNLDNLDNLGNLGATNSQSKNNDHSSQQLAASFGQLELDEIDLWIASMAPAFKMVHDEAISEAHKKESQNFRNPETLFLQDENISAYKRRRMIPILIGAAISMLLGGFASGYYLGNCRVSDAELQQLPHIPDAKCVLVEGILFFRDEFGNKNPDADACVLILPKNRTPTLPLSTAGFSPNAANSHHMSDSIQQIQELGGAFTRTGADGTFSLELPSEGNYSIILVSSHAHCNEEAKDSLEMSDLKSFFLSPKDIVSNYQFEKDDYSLTFGTQKIQKTFVFPRAVR